MKIHVLVCLSLLVGSAQAREYHVAKNGSDEASGAKDAPFLTIQRAADVAQPGDTITVHEGIYREEITPPRGGKSDATRITYQAAPGHEVVIKGSEVIKGWKQVDGDVWMVRLPNAFFGNFNPYSDLIHGDWYQSRQPYHTGAVYLNGHWLKEAPRKAALLGEDNSGGEARDLLVVRSFRPKAEPPIPASSASSRQLAAGGETKGMVGPLQDGDWLAFDRVAFGEHCNNFTIASASPVGGALVEVRLGSPSGKLICTVDAGLTAEWTHDQNFTAGLEEPISGVHDIVLVVKTRPVEEDRKRNGRGLWYAEVEEEYTTLWAEFKGVDPNEERVEINVRQSVFYPRETNRNYITVRGFILEQAANPWSPPTAEQIGLIGTNWSKGWVIEDNTIRYAACTGVTLGKHGDEYDNTYAYNRSIRIAKERGWNRDTIGGHLVRNNHIYRCGQAGIVGSMGCAFSTVEGNEIHDIRQDHDYGGCETAGIKFHGAIDTVIRHNHIYRCAHWGGIWLDWMGQGARVSGNLLHDNSNDLMVEMNHGPMLIDNNLFLSENGGIRDASGGGAYVHNLVRGKQEIWSNLVKRRTPYFKPHSVEIIEQEPPADNPFVAQGGRKARFNDPVAKTEQDTVYQTVRYGVETYQAQLPNGRYEVTLKFVEPVYESAGQRVFSVSLQGTPVVEALDVQARAGKNVALDLTTPCVLVEDGTLTIGFASAVGQACIAGIKLKGDGNLLYHLNCGGDAWEDFVADVTPEVADAVAKLGLPIGVTVDQHDDRFLNNLFVGSRATSYYDKFGFEIRSEGNVYLGGAAPTEREQAAVVDEAFDPALQLREERDGWWLTFTIDPAWQSDQPRALITTELLGRAAIPDAPFEEPDGSPYRIDRDYFGELRNVADPAPGPFRARAGTTLKWKVWPRS